MTELVVVFLLFVAVLAFAWFYFQRAKARDAGTEPASAAPEPTDAPAPNDTNPAT